MCGRFALGIPRRRLAEHFGLALVPEAPLRYNIAPSQLVEAVILDRETDAMGFRLFRWGLTPFWAKDPAIGSRLINARSETAAEKPAFRAALRHRRCLVPAGGFYEWKASGRRKQPYYVSLADEDVFSMAGLFEHWESPAGEVLMSCALLTRRAEGEVARIHDRMPVVVAPGDYRDWLNPRRSDPAVISSYFCRFTPSFVVRPVGLAVNNPRVDDASLLDPLSPGLL